MSHLLRKPFGSHGKLHEITPQSAGWRHVGFTLYRLNPGETVAEATGPREAILVMVEGKARFLSTGPEDAGPEDSSTAPGDAAPARTADPGAGPHLARSPENGPEGAAGHGPDHGQNARQDRSPGPAAEPRAETGPTRTDPAEAIPGDAVPAEDGPGNAADPGAGPHLARSPENDPENGPDANPEAGSQPGPQARPQTAAPGNAGIPVGGGPNPGARDGGPDRGVRDGGVRDWGVLGDRMDVFEKTPPHCLYLPPRHAWRAIAETACTLAVCTAPLPEDPLPQHLLPQNLLAQHLPAGHLPAQNPPGENPPENPPQHLPPPHTRFAPGGPTAATTLATAATPGTATAAGTIPATIPGTAAAAGPGARPHATPATALATAPGNAPGNVLETPPDTAPGTAPGGITAAIPAAPRKPCRLGPEGITLTQRGEGTNTRWINNIAMEAEPAPGALLVTEVFTPAGNWSSYPSHRHDEDDYPRITYLEETYYHRVNPADGWALQRIYTDDGTLDECIAVKNHDVTLVPKGHHPCAAPHGIELYYLNVMAGPKRAWKFQPAPETQFLMPKG